MLAASSRTPSSRANSASGLMAAARLASVVVLVSTAVVRKVSASVLVLQRLARGQKVELCVAEIAVLQYPTSTMRILARHFDIAVQVEPRHQRIASQTHWD